MRSSIYKMIKQLIDYQEIFEKETEPFFIRNIQDVIDNSTTAYLNLEEDYVSGKDCLEKLILAVIDSDLLNCFYTSTIIFIKYSFDMINQYNFLKYKNVTFLELAKSSQYFGFDTINKYYDAKNVDIHELIKVFFQIKILQLNYIRDLTFSKLENNREDLLKDYVLQHNKLIRGLNANHNDLLYFVYTIKYFFEEKENRSF
ncbi:hypothetical protein COBT_001127 [Conglomerata obtusa]